jgi:hypothetical protein
MRAVLAALLLTGLVAAPARADVDETERRLKSAGIDDALRARIHQAIARGVAFLRARQQPNGSVAGVVVRGVVPPWATPRPGETALAALALAHADTPEALEASAKAESYLLDDLEGVPDVGFRSSVRDVVESQTYETSIAALLLSTRRRRPEVLERLAASLARRQGPSGWWGYRAGDGFPNLSTTQFAALGLWAAQRRGGKVPVEVWRLLAKSHLRTQSKSGTWGYQPKRAARDDLGLLVYPQGTFMGLANLRIASDALAEEMKADKAFARRVRAGLDLAEAALARDGADFVRAFEEKRITSVALGGWSYYALYALEKACLFSRVEEVEGVRWYERGARALVATQEADGSWPAFADRFEDPRLVSTAIENDVVRTSFALLFLLRSSSTYRGDVTPGTSPGTPPAK